MAATAAAGGSVNGEAGREDELEPSPGVLSTQIRPPISSTSRLQMVRPSPVPPYLRVVEPSAWRERLEQPAACSGVMPMPVSRTREAQLDAVSPRPARRSTIDADLARAR